MSRWPSKRLLKRMAREEMPDYAPRDSAHIQGSMWDEWDDAGELVESPDEVSDELQR